MKVFPALKIDFFHLLDLLASKAKNTSPPQCSSIDGEEVIYKFMPFPKAFDTELLTVRLPVDPWTVINTELITWNLEGLCSKDQIKWDPFEKKERKEERNFRKNEQLEEEINKNLRK